ncbi:LPS export ABC transporter periplasmic protein LptC [Halonatronum saccharophilum]|uniref:LPS export ABC transporter periplasmic protein LptC n=1 Tax=Halonatronum saccharophilum TaxID=150060 RepID=UPI0004856DFA|nr:LPS export ABC transporter periplasmic protein LptC [Halonatronum saccharophilum]
MKKTNVYLLIILVVIIGGGFLVYEIITSSGEVDSPDPKYQYQIRESRVVSYDGGEKRWDILALRLLEPRLSRDDNEARMILEDITEGKLFNRGKVEYRLNANRATYYKSSKNVNLEGNVILKQKSGEEIRGEKLRWVDRSQELISNEDVWVKLLDGDLYAKSMVMDLEKDIVDFSGGVEMEFDMRGAEEDEE